MKAAARGPTDVHWNAESAEGNAGCAETAVQTLKEAELTCEHPRFSLQSERLAACCSC